MPLYAHDLACLHLRSSQPASVTSTIEVGAGVNPHRTRCPTGAKFPATSCLGASRTPTASVRGGSRHAGVRETYTIPDLREAATMLVAPPTAFEDVDGSEGSRIGVGGDDLELRSCGNTEELC